MNILKTAIIVVSIASLSFAQVSSDTVNKHTDIRISKSMTFEHVNIEKYFEDPGIIIITGAEMNDTMELKLNRSFRQELSSNVDKETVERMF
jgi:hypothetical protein